MIFWQPYHLIQRTPAFAQFVFQTFLWILKMKLSAVLNRSARICDALFVASISVMCSPAFAQLEKAKQGISTIQTWLLSIAAGCITIALMFVGFRMAFQAAQWKDVAPVFWGGVIIGAAPGIAAMFVG